MRKSRPEWSGQSLTQIARAVDRKVCTASTWLTNWQTNWLIDWLTDWLTASLPTRLTGWMAAWMTHQLNNEPACLPFCPPDWGEINTWSARRQVSVCLLGLNFIFFAQNMPCKMNSTAQLASCCCTLHFRCWCSKVLTSLRWVRPTLWMSGGEQSFQATTRQNAITNIQFATFPQIVWRTAANAVPLVACGNLFDLRTVNLAGNSTIF